MFDIEKILCLARAAAEGGARARPGAIPALAGELEGGLLAGHANVTSPSGGGRD
jgi:hypothetical protein